MTPKEASESGARRRGAVIFGDSETQVDRALKAGQQSGQVLHAECESLGG